MTIGEDYYELIAGLPGEEIIVPGLKSLQNGDYDSPDALLTLMAVPRMTAAGFEMLKNIPLARFENLEGQLYERLGRDNGSDAYGRYCSSKARLSRFMSALEHRLARQRAKSS